MRSLTNDELVTVSGGRGINIGSILSGNSAANGNTVDTGHNSVDASGNASGNSSSLSANTAANTVNETMTSAKTVLNDLVGGVL